MNADPNLSVVTLVAHALGSLCQEFMLVGGCSVGLLITDQARPPVRQTADVDLVAEVATLADYYSLRPRLNAAGFREDSSEDHICRWRKADLIVDVMPTTEVLGHSVNRWYADAVKASWPMSLPGGEQINVISAPFFIATKLESFNSRGAGDYLHHDMEDILNIVDGREELLTELASVPPGVREFIRTEIGDHLAYQTFVDQLEWVFPDGRFTIVIERLRMIAAS